MRILALGLAVWPGVALAWEKLDGAGITAALSDRTLIFDAYTRQSFAADGRTIFLTERRADGRWRVEGDRYCSAWPPSETWTCYDMEAEGDGLRFISDDGAVSTGQYLQ